MKFRRQKKHKQRRNKESEDARLALLAKELGIAGMTVLVNDFEFTPEMAQHWLELMVDQAKLTRSMISAKMSYEKVKGPIENDC